MKEIIKLMLNLWDPYGIYIFPDNEYESYSLPILDYLSKEKNLTIEEISKFLYELLPKEANSNIMKLDLVEYKRFAQLLIELKKTIK